MGIFDFLAYEGKCPQCGEAGAKRFLWRTRCRNVACSHFDRSFLYEQTEPAASVESAPAPARRPAGNFDPGSDGIRIEYRNFKGEEKTFVGDQRTIRIKGEHVTLSVVPTGRRIALKKSRIRNLSKLDAIFSNQPSPRERQVIGYHRKRGTTSPLYESIKRKYGI